MPVTGTDLLIVPFIALWPDEMQNHLWAFSNRVETLRVVGVFVIPNYWYMYTAEEMKWCTDCLD